MHIASLLVYKINFLQQDSFSMNSRLFESKINQIENQILSIQVRKRIQQLNKDFKSLFLQSENTSTYPSLRPYLFSYLSFQTQQKIKDKQQQKKPERQYNFDENPVSNSIKFMQTHQQINKNLINKRQELVQRMQNVMQIHQSQAQNTNNQFQRKSILKKKNVQIVKFDKSKNLQSQQLNTKNHQIQPSEQNNAPQVQKVTIKLPKGKNKKRDQSQLQAQVQAYLHHVPQVQQTSQIQIILNCFQRLKGSKLTNHNKFMSQLHRIYCQEGGLKTKQQLKIKLQKDLAYEIRRFDEKQHKNNKNKQRSRDK